MRTFFARQILNICTRYVVQRSSIMRSRWILKKCRFYYEKPMNRKKVPGSKKFKAQKVSLRNLKSVLFFEEFQIHISPSSVLFQQSWKKLIRDFRYPWLEKHHNYHLQPRTSFTTMQSFFVCDNVELDVEAIQAYPWICSILDLGSWSKSWSSCSNKTYSQVAQAIY